MYQRKELIDHLLIIMIISGYNQDMKIYKANPDLSEWVTNYVCEIPRRYSPKDIIPELSVLTFIWDVILVM